MAEYIEREVALAICEKTYQERIRMSDWCGDTVAWNIGHDIKAIPSADVQPVRHGRWRLYSPLTDTYECDKCGYQVIDESFRTNFCPECGADMREGEAL